MNDFLNTAQFESLGFRFIQVYVCKYSIKVPEVVVFICGWVSSRFQTDNLCVVRVHALCESMSILVSTIGY